ncbi:MAG: HD domain-containing phosphohydrolase [Phycisphaerae bacterium]|jgi:HD-GYP domain-containing protein (c-di-GMP phosphodiesterase class II)|nr:HD domain-containing phosphohydrolase [Phycisphaerae bacterium]
MAAEMLNATEAEQTQQQTQVLSSLLEVGRQLYAHENTHEMLDTILTHARTLTRAEAGSMFLVHRDCLKFAAVQNAQIDTSTIAHDLLGETMSASMDSLAGFVALTGEIANISDTYNLPEGTPFRINRDFDTATGYKTRSILAVPLNCPDGTCVGVLQLINCVASDGRPEAFGDPSDSGVLLLASSAAVTVHNAILQEQLYQAHLGTIYRLAVVAEYRDNDTGDHIRRVSRTSELIARAMGMENELVERIKNASQMHDVGKVAVPDSILLKPGHLTTEQRAVMEKHTTIAAEILGHPEDEVLAMGRDIALNHHERWDGQGYPNGISGRDIPLSARVVAVADVFDAVISHRCYKTACSFDVALDIIAKDSGRHFDPEVTQAFFIAIDDILESYRSSEACR